MDRSVCCQCMESATPSNGKDKAIGCKLDPQCQSFVCDFDDYCCTVLWDKTCSFYASGLCIDLLSLQFVSKRFCFFLEKCEKTSVRVSTTEIFEAVEEDEGLDVNIIWRVGLAVFGVMAICVICCCVFVFVLKCFCNKKRGTNTTDFQTNTSINAATTTTIETTLDEVETETKAERGKSKKQQRGKSMDHYHVRVAVADDDDDDEEDENGNGLGKVRKIKKRRKRIKVGDNDEAEEDSKHPLFDRKCRSNSF